MGDGKVDSWGEEPSSVFLVFRRKTPRNKHKKPRKCNWRKSSPVVIILAVLAITGTSYYLSRPSLTSAAGPAVRLGVHASPSQLSGSASFGEEQGNAPAPRTHFTPNYRRQSSGISAIPSPAPPDPGHTRQFTPPVMRSPFTVPSSAPTSTLSFPARPTAEPAVTPATPAARSSSPAAETATAAVINVTSTALGAVGAAAAIVGLLDGKLRSWRLGPATMPAPEPSRPRSMTSTGPSWRCCARMGASRCGRYRPGCIFPGPARTCASSGWKRPG